MILCKNKREGTAKVLCKCKRRRSTTIENSRKHESENWIKTRNVRIDTDVDEKIFYSHTLNYITSFAGESN